MTKKLKLSDFAEFDPTKYLDDDAAVAEYITLTIEDGDSGLLAAALGDVARARGMTHGTGGRIDQGSAVQGAQTRCISSV